MSKLLKILFTPLMLVLSLVVVAAGIIWYKILVKIYEFAWRGWE